MLGVFNRLPHVACEVGTCTWISNSLWWAKVDPLRPFQSGAKMFQRRPVEA